jgi:DNA-binding IclR family transcriptional regulator
MVVERIRSLRGPEEAARADAELPEKLDPEADADLLRGYGIDPEEVRRGLRGQAPEAG